MPGTFLDATRCDRVRRLADVHPQSTVVELTGISTSTLHHLRKRGFRPASRQLRPVPSDWGIVAPGRTNEWLRLHYRAGFKTLRRWRQEKPVPQPGKGSNRRRERPADLREVLGRMSVTEAQAHYGASNRLMTKWRHQIGIAVRFEAPIARSWVEQRQIERQAESAR